MSVIDLESGLISREIFCDSGIYRREQEQIFAHCWLFIGHEGQIPEPGDFFTSCMGEESVVLVRDADRRPRVFLNSCPHRGMKVCRYDEGNTAAFTCPYHGWSFATDGRLIGVPHFEQAYFEELDRSRWGLVEVAQLDSYKGTIWATWDDSAPPLLDYLGDMTLYLDLALDCRDGREGGSEVLGGVQKWFMDCNWKFPAENFAGDFYHDISHRSVDLAGIGPSGAGRRDNERLATHPVNIAFPDLGHAAMIHHQIGDVPHTPMFRDDPLVRDYFARAYDERKRRCGDRARMLGRVGTVFPSMSFLARQPRSIAVWHPRGPSRTEVWRWFLVDADAPDPVKDALRHYYMRYSGPAGLTEQDDMENWTQAAAASKGTIARRQPYNYQMGLGHAGHDDLFRGVTSTGYSEENQRAFYKRWAELMADRREGEREPEPSPSEDDQR